MRNATRILWSYRLFPAMLALMAMSWPVCLAQLPSVQALDYQNGALLVQSSMPMEAPDMEAWPGNVGANATELVILSFPHATANLATLQQMGNQLILKNPELKRFLASPLSSDTKKGSSGFQMVVEIAIPPNTEIHNPATSLVQPNQWLIALKPNAQFTVAAAVSAPKLQETPTAPPESKQASAVKPNGAAPVVHETDPQLLHTIQGLQAQITQLNDALQASAGKQQALQEQLTQYTDFIRPYQPEFNGTRADQATIQNLRLALVKVAEKLKATEAALAAQTEKTKDLARQLATLKNDPSIATDPSLLVAVADDTSVAINPAPNPIAPEAMRSQPTYSSPSPTKAAMPVTPPRKTVPISVQSLQTQLHANPTQWQTYLDLSARYSANGNPNEAESTLLRLLKANPGYAPGYYHLAQLYVQEKRKLEAQAAMDTYQRLQPSDTHGIQALQASIRSLSSITGSSNSKKLTASKVDKT